MKRRILILLFALLFLLPSCAAGGGDGAPDDGASALTPDPGAIEAVEETEFDWYAALPAGTNFGGSFERRGIQAHARSGGPHQHPG